MRAAAARSNRVRSTPARNASGTAANEIRKSTQTTEYDRAATWSETTEASRRISASAQVT